MNTQEKYLVAVVGAGPAGLFAARELAAQNVHVVLINRDIKPGGLAEYGIYPDKIKMKEGLRAQFRQILSLPDLEYYGNLTIGEHGDLSLAELRSLGFQAILVTAGAQGTKWLGLPGEKLDGVYHAKDIVYYYNRLPPFSEKKFHIGRRVAVIGAGNVSIDICRFLATLPQVEEIYAVIRRGPAEIKFSRPELENMVNLLDRADLAQEIAALTPLMQSLGQNPADFYTFIQGAQERACETASKAKFRLRFLASPTSMLGNSQGLVTGMEVEENTMVMENGEAKAIGLGTRHVMDVDTVIFAIGDRVDPAFGLPVQGSEFVKNQSPLFPVEDVSYETFDPQAKCPIEGIFVSGWSRKASSGLVGVARKDGVNGARAVLQYLKTRTPLPELPLEAITHRFSQVPRPLIHQAELARLNEVEREQAQQRGLLDFKFSSNQEMLAAVGLLPEGLLGSTGSRG